MMIGNIDQNGIRNTYRNQPMPGVMMPTKVNSPRMPKMNPPSRMRSGQPSGGPLKCRNSLDAREPLASDSAATVLPSSVAMIASTPSEMPLSKSPALNDGVMTLRMMRLDTASVSAPSSP